MRNLLLTFVVLAISSIAIAETTKPEGFFRGTVFSMRMECGINFSGEFTPYIDKIRIYYRNMRTQDSKYQTMDYRLKNSKNPYIISFAKVIKKSSTVCNLSVMGGAECKEDQIEYYVDVFLNRDLIPVAFHRRKSSVNSEVCGNLKSEL